VGFCFRDSDSGSVGFSFRDSDPDAIVRSKQRDFYGAKNYNTEVKNCAIIVIDLKKHKQSKDPRVSKHSNQQTTRKLIEK